MAHFARRGARAAGEQDGLYFGAVLPASLAFRRVDPADGLYRAVVRPGVDLYRAVRN
jgi:hypothetical protein